MIIFIVLVFVHPLVIYWNYFNMKEKRQKKKKRMTGRGDICEGGRRLATSPWQNVLAFSYTQLSHLNHPLSISLYHFHNYILILSVYIHRSLFLFIVFHFQLSNPVSLVLGKFSKRLSLNYLFD